MKCSFSNAPADALQDFNAVAAEIRNTMARGQFRCLDAFLNHVNSGFFALETGVLERVGSAVSLLRSQSAECSNGAHFERYKAGIEVILNR